MHLLKSIYGTSKSHNKYTAANITIKQIIYNHWFLHYYYLCYTATNVTKQFNYGKSLLYFHSIQMTGQIYLQRYKLIAVCFITLEMNSTWAIHFKWIWTTIFKWNLDKSTILTHQTFACSQSFAHNIKHSERERGKKRTAQWIILFSTRFEMIHFNAWWNFFFSFVFGQSHQVRKRKIQFSSQNNA